MCRLDRHPTISLSRWSVFGILVGKFFTTLDSVHTKESQIQIDGALTKQGNFCTVTVVFQKLSHLDFLVLQS